MSDLTDEESDPMLRDLFKRCDDEIRTGQVRSVDLINALQKLLNNDVDRGHIEKLRTMLDPKNDNAYLTIDEFVKVGKDWIDFVKMSKEEIGNIENRSELSNVPNIRTSMRQQLPPIFPADLKRQKMPEMPDKKVRHKVRKVPISHSDSSLGILDVNNLDAGASGDGSFDGEFHLSQEIGNYQAIQLDKLSREVEELRRQNQRLAEDKNNLNSQFLSLEDNFFQITKDNEALKSKIKTLETHADINCSPSSKYLCQSEVSLQTEEECISLEEHKMLKDELKQSFILENSRLQDELEKYKESLSIARQNWTDCNLSMDELNKELENLRRELAKKESELQEVEKEKNHVEFLLSETQLIKERLDAEISLCKSQLALQLDKQWEVTPFEHRSGDVDKLFEVSTDFPEGLDIFETQRKEKGPSAFSTPFDKKYTRPCRGSIGDEIKKLGVEGSPLFDKSQLSMETANASTQTEPTTKIPEKRAEKPSRPKARCSAKTLFMTGLTLIAFLAIFTFFGGIKCGNQRLYPITWSPTYGLPEPFFLIDFEPEHKLEFW